MAMAVMGGGDNKAATIGISLVCFSTFLTKITKECLNHGGIRARLWLAALGGSRQERNGTSVGRQEHQSLYLEHTNWQIVGYRAVSL
jgi:hypothetical protein